MATEVALDPFPVAFIVTHLLAAGADRDQPLERLDLG